MPVSAAAFALWSRLRPVVVDPGADVSGDDDRPAGHRARTRSPEDGHLHTLHQVVGHALPVPHLLGGLTALRVGRPGYQLGTARLRRPRERPGPPGEGVRRVGEEVGDAAQRLVIAGCSMVSTSRPRPGIVCLKVDSFAML